MIFDSNQLSRTLSHAQFIPALKTQSFTKKREYRNGSVIATVTDPEFLRKTRDNGRPFGSLPGFKTNLGVVAVPTIPVGGYVYCPVAKRWVIFAVSQSSPASTGRGTRRGGGTTLAKRKRG